MAMRMGMGTGVRHLRLRPYVALEIQLVQVVERAALAKPGVQVDHARAVLDQQRARVQAALRWNAARTRARVTPNLYVLAASVMRLLHNAVKDCERGGRVACLAAAHPAAGADAELSADAHPLPRVVSKEEGGSPPPPSSFLLLLLVSK